MIGDVRFAVGGKKRGKNVVSVFLVSMSCKNRDT